MALAGPLVFAGKSVASSVIKEVVTKAFKYLDGYLSAESMKEMKNKIEDQMPQIQAVLDVVSPDHIKEESEALDRWFWKLRDAIEEAEDAIDELEYYELEEKAKDRKVSDWGSPSAKVKHKVVKSVKSVSVLDNTLKQFTHRDTLKRLKKAMEGLDKASAGMTKFLEVVKCLKTTSSRPKEEDLMNNDRQTGSTSTVTKFFGREEEKKFILEWLTKEITLEEDEIVMSTKHIPILSLVGHGGMGKTTLVQSICEEGNVVKDFEIIWVTVSTSFDATSVTGKILESVNRKSPKAGSLEALQQLLKDNLKSIKFLLILDDVWEEEKRNEWEKLFAPLRTGKGGSKILLTTRMASVAAMAANVMGIGNQCLRLEGLKEDENFGLFNHYVFSGLNSQSYSHLKLTGEQIARKLGGCPLVTKVVSGHLQGNMTSEFWDRFLHNGLQDFKGNANDIMKVLRLSYYNLPMELQICFRYCSIFPHDYNFTKKDLVLMWIGSGLISNSGDEAKRLEDIGEHYLDQLTRKSFFEQKTRARVDIMSINPRIEEYYAMHDLIHELAEYVSSGECKRIISLTRIEDVKDTIRHLWISDINGSYVEEVKKVTNFKNLRTLIIGEDISPSVHQDMKCAINSAIENSRALRLLQLKWFNHYDFPRRAGNLKHLRYISIRHTTLKSMHGVLKLYHLMLLHGYCDLRLNRNQARDLANLDRLRYLYFDRGVFNEIPVSRLTSLQELNNYSVQGSGNRICAIQELRDLREIKLQGLENVDSNEAEKAKLKEKEYLFSLSLEWSASNGTQNRKDDLVLDQLEPHANIGKLQIDGYEGLRPPFWLQNLSVRKLVSLTLRNCTNWEHLPSLADLVLLKHLKLHYLPKLEQIGWSSHMFSCSRMEFFPIGLHTLEVKGCKGLKELPILPPSLVSLEIQNTGLTKLPMIGAQRNDSTQSKSSKWLDISIKDCPSLSSLYESFLDQKQYLMILRDVQISNCIHVESVPLTFQQMNGLRRLYIENCPKLRTPSDAKLLPSSLKHLSMCNSGDLEHLLLGSMQQLFNLSFMELRFCSTLVSLPSEDVFKNLKSLKSIRVSRCENLSSLGGLGSVLSLSRLSIIGCNYLAEVTPSPMPGASASKDDHLVVHRNSLRIENLEIDLPSLLLVEPLKSLCQTQKLLIQDASEMEGLPEQWLPQNHSCLQYLMIHKAESVESLPLSMQDMSSLEQLNLFGAAQLQSLPYFPSLQYLGIEECDSELEGKSREKGSPEWNKISHIPRVRLGDSYFILGKECGKKTFKTLWFEDYNGLVSWVNQPEDNGNRVESALHWWQKPRCLGRNTS